MTLIPMEPGAAKVVGKLLDAGFAAYAVGGCVRDALLNREPHDWDICSGALPQQTLELFGEENCIPTGLKHGTITVKMEGGFYEVTTFRTDGNYSDGRHPDSVDFVADVREDLARRDFTINAMAYNDRDGLVDPFGGREDLLNRRIVRAVGEAMARFEEDALRVMRLFRFASRYGLAIEEKTLAAAIALRENLRRVSGERTREELLKLFETKKPAAYLPFEIACIVMPEFETKERDFARALAAVDALPLDAQLRLAALLYPLCTAQNTGAAKDVMKRLRCSNRTMERVTRAIAGALEDYSGDEASMRAKIRRRLGEWGAQALDDIDALAQVLRSGEDARAIRALVLYAKEAKARGLCCSMKELTVGGADVMRVLGGGAGPRVGEMLERLFDAVLTDRLPNERETLLAAVREMASENGMRQARGGDEAVCAPSA